MDFERRFGGLNRLYGDKGAQRIRASHIAVIGIGGVGSWAVETLARSGVGRLTLIDLDHVAESNINRQIHALESTLGQAKVLAMKERIAQINPLCQVNCIEEFVLPENWPALLPSGVTAVIDACDQIKAKVAVSAWAMAQQVTFITVGAAGGKRLAHLVEIADLSKVTHDPLISKLRYDLRKKHNAVRGEGVRIGVECVFSREAVQIPDESCMTGLDGSLNCSGYGSQVAVTATMGQCAAGWILDRASRTTIDENKTL
jgi:tRNA threonylcarbamoyladenosine dehydratase